MQPGLRLGPYEIVSAIGAGGMGEVYRATDTNLKRAVAIKVLPDSLAGDPDRLARFQREAEVLAALNHPNIAHIHGLEKSGGTIALVMELAEGKTLEEFIAAGPLPLDDALRIARQIADALAAAHDQAIVHRDLKPANIKVRADGMVKVLDFGLAKAADVALSGGVDAPGGSSRNMSMSPTLTTPQGRGMTQAGVILGTPAYMSPEQARGKPADRRSDIWSFGCVLFEMLSGRQLFGGTETLSDAIAAVLTRDPDWTALPIDLPASLRTLLRRCLQRDPDRRLHDIADARLDLDDAAAGPIATAVARNSGRPGVLSGRALPWAVAVVALGMAAAALWAPWRHAGAAGTGERPAIQRLEIDLPAGVELFTTTSRTAALSHDGSQLAFIGVVGNARLVYLRPLDRFEALPIAGTDGATECFFSDDGKSIAFLTAAGVMKTVSLADGQVTTVSGDVNVEHGAAWLADGSFVFGRGDALWRTTRPGAPATQLTTLGGAGNDTLHEWPAPLPGGKAILFVAMSGDAARIEALDLAAGERHVVVPRGTLPQFTADGHLLFFRDGDLIAVPFDPVRLAVTGSSSQTILSMPSAYAVPALDVSASGAMVYAPTAAVTRLAWVSRQGVEQPANDVPRPYANPRIASDGTRLLVQATDLWVQDLARTTFTRLTTSNVAAAGFPIWTPDGRRAIYRAPSGLRVQDAEGSGRGELIAGTNEFDYPAAVTPDGNTLVFLRSSQETSYDIYTLPLRGGTPEAILKTRAYEGGARLSPDGKWLSYVSNESGRYEVYLRPFPGPDRRWQVSTDGGTQAVWNPSGKEVFYRNGNKMMAVDVATTPQVVLSQPRVLFDERYAFGTGITIANYDVSRDGQRFLMVKDEANAARLNIVLNLFAAAAR